MNRFIAGSFFWSLALPLLYEGYAIVFRGDPTISRIVAYSLSAQPLWGAFYAFLAGLVVMLLALHFTGALPWWRP